MMDRLLELIPEFYYDLIARVIPGMVLITISIPSRYWKIILGQDDLPISKTFVLFIFSYVVGFLLDSFSTAIEGWIGDHFRDKTIFSLLDKVDNHNRSKRFIKLLAELSLLRVLLTGWLIIGINWKLFIIELLFSLNNFLYFGVFLMLLTAYLKWYLCTEDRLISYIDKYVSLDQ